MEVLVHQMLEFSLDMDKDASGRIEKFPEEGQGSI